METPLKQQWLSEYLERTNLLLAEQNMPLLFSFDDAKENFQWSLHNLLCEALYLDENQTILDFTELYEKPEAIDAARTLLFEDDQDMDAMQTIIDTINPDMSYPAPSLDDNPAPHRSKDDLAYSPTAYFPLSLAIETVRRLNHNDVKGNPIEKNLRTAPALFVQILQTHLIRVFGLPKEKVEALTQEDVGRMLKDPVAMRAAKQFVFNGEQLGFLAEGANQRDSIFENVDTIRMLDSICDSLGLVEFERDVRIPNAKRSNHPDLPDAHHRSERVLVHGVMPVDVIHSYSPEDVISVQTELLNMLRNADYNVPTSPQGALAVNAISDETWRSCFTSAQGGYLTRSLCEIDSFNISHQHGTPREKALESIAQMLGIERKPAQQVESGTIHDNDRLVSARQAREAQRDKAQQAERSR